MTDLRCNPDAGMKKPAVRPLIIGLTGPTGAGKGTVAAQFARYGVPSIDTDAVYHALLVPPSACLDELVARFGREILCPDGTLNRRALADRVFVRGTEADHNDLNTITHRYVLARTRELCADYAAAGVRAVLVDAPLLFESHFDRECGRILTVMADPDVRLVRIMARDGLPLGAAMSRLRAQKPDDFYTSRADAIIRNEGGPELLEPEVVRLMREWGIDGA